MGNSLVDFSWSRLLCTFNRISSNISLQTSSRQILSSQNLRIKSLFYLFFQVSETFRYALLDDDVDILLLQLSEMTEHYVYPFYLVY